MNVSYSPFASSSTKPTNYISSPRISASFVVCHPLSFSTSRTSQPGAASPNSHPLLTASSASLRTRSRHPCLVTSLSSDLGHFACAVHQENPLTRKKLHQHYLRRRRPCERLLSSRIQNLGLIKGLESRSAGISNTCCCHSRCCNRSNSHPISRSSWPSDSPSKTTGFLDPNFDLTTTDPLDLNLRRFEPDPFLSPPQAWVQDPSLEDASAAEWLGSPASHFGVVPCDASSTPAVFPPSSSSSTIPHHSFKCSDTDPTKAFFRHVLWTAMASPTYSSHVTTTRSPRRTRSVVARYKDDRAAGGSGSGSGGGTKLESDETEVNEDTETGHGKSVKEGEFFAGEGESGVVEETLKNEINRAKNNISPPTTTTTSTIPLVLLLRCRRLFKTLSLLGILVLMSLWPKRRIAIRVAKDTRKLYRCTMCL
mmetsp:Transcript_26740/g.49107  ORF Transcript_26740/g.49107 Transcript_26740/m.49107 type:complete len:424 (+) Transcript_26740:167-1438(+)